MSSILLKPASFSPWQWDSTKNVWFIEVNGVRSMEIGSFGVAVKGRYLRGKL